jgi:predicted dinucleotide-binding enzyme
MNITIIGTGNMARGIATRAIEAGNDVTLLGTYTEKAEALAGDLPGDVHAGQVGDPLAGEVVVLAIPYGAVDDVLARYGEQVDGKVLVDGQPLDVLIAADDVEAKGAVTSIVADSGLRPIDAGPLSRARELEALGYLHMAIQQPLETNFTSTVKVLG